ncbi:hypothetical protein Slin15195_G051450 [Septoria linicola]|uniref:Secreted protein n=1 Tax=Septoria linicola TaxID=215465 RepID=A0A9Q9EHH5_9PEZI|nr:hypothetical protein Slin15195_G051450 [Septoria linicola]
MRIIRFLLVAAMVAFTCAQDGDDLDEDSRDLTAADLLSYDDSDIHHCTIDAPEKQAWSTTSSAEDIVLTCVLVHSSIGMLPSVM